MVTLAITGVARAEVEITDAVTREFSVYNGSLEPVEVTDAVTREFSVYNGSLEPVEVTDSVTREFSLYNGSLGPVEVTDAVTREFSVFKHGAVSRKTHGSVGTFDVAVHVPGAVEPRQAGPTKLIVTFNQEVQTPGGPTTEDIALSSGTVTGVAFYTHNGPQLTIDMTGAANQANLVVSYPGLTDDQGAPLAETLCFGVLTGDANGDQRVNIFDLVQVRNALNQAPTQSTFTRDVTADGAINIFDLVAVRNVLNTALANACP
ncbi:MAG: hypothetical protein GXY55_16630 [Phycisphaerae bacterium]|mgnify:FL=1|nr:hypothetical protein [Phycisphaerae bacterium]